jgi:hypothetical protein
MLIAIIIGTLLFGGGACGTGTFAVAIKVPCARSL